MSIIYKLVLAYTGHCNRYDIKIVMNSFWNWYDPFVRRRFKDDDELQAAVIQHFQETFLQMCKIDSIEILKYIFSISYP